MNYYKSIFQLNMYHTIQFVEKKKTYIKCEQTNKWIKFNDMSVKELILNDNIFDNTYIL